MRPLPVEELKGRRKRTQTESSWPGGFHRRLQSNRTPSKSNNRGEVGAALFLREEAGIHRARSRNQLSGLTSSPKEQGGPTAQEEVWLPTSQQGHMRPEPAHHTGWGGMGCVCVYACAVLARPLVLDPREGHSYSFWQLPTRSHLSSGQRSLETLSTLHRVQLLAWPGCHTVPQLCHVPNGLGIFPIAMLPSVTPGSSHPLPDVHSIVKSMDSLHKSLCSAHLHQPHSYAGHHIIFQPG